MVYPKNTTRKHRAISPWTFSHINNQDEITREYTWSGKDHRRMLVKWEYPTKEAQEINGFILIFAGFIRSTFFS